MFTHLVPALYFTVHLVTAIFQQGPYSLLGSSWQSTGFVAFAALASAFDNWSSVAYHLYNVMGPCANDKLLTYDLVGIVVVTLSHTIGIGFIIFDDWTTQRDIIVGTLAPAIVINIIVLLHPKCRSVDLHNYKVILITATQISTLIASLYGRFVLYNDYTLTEVYPRIESAFISLTLGFFFWLSKVPECIPFLGKYETV